MIILLFNIKKKMIKEKAIDDTVRRNNGIFLTPTLFVDYAHKMISEQLGEKWKDEYVVWDNCCGSKNLTRDYKFKELYCSTLFDSELNIGERYNKEATSFQFDFLNDYIPMPGELIQDNTKIPEGLLNAFKENKKIVFFLNPPYVGNAGNGKGNDNGNGYTDNISKQNMQKQNLDGTKELFNQFLFNIIRIKENYKLTNCAIVLFCKPSYLTLPSYKKFRAYFLNNFNYISGILFNAGEFANVSQNWGIDFTIWVAGNSLNRDNFIHNLVENNNGEIKILDTKSLYNLDNIESLKDWYSKYKPTDRNIEYPGFKSVPHIFDETLTQKVSEDTIGIISNNMSGWNLSNVYLSMKGGYRYLVTYKNFKESCVFLAANALKISNWINDKDGLCVPSNLTNEFINDSIIYSIFWTQVGLRQKIYKGKLWDIKNEFCWYDIDMVKKLSNENNLDFTYNDAATMERRYVYKYIQEHINGFSKESMDVLNKANEMVWKSFKYRELFNEEHPEYQILNADIGYYQLKALYKEYMKEDLEEFKKLYKVLADKMRPMVYELGFLRK